MKEFNGVVYPDEHVLIPEENIEYGSVKTQQPRYLYKNRDDEACISIRTRMNTNIIIVHTDLGSDIYSANYISSIPERAVNVKHIDSVVRTDRLEKIGYR